MASTTEREIVLKTDLITVGLFRARPHEPKFRESGPIDNDIIVFPRTCVSITHEGREPVITSPNIVVFYNRGQLYLRDKISERGDLCDWFSFAPEVLAEAFSRRGGRLRAAPGRPFGMTHGPSDPRSYLMQRMVVEHIQEHPEPDRLLVEETLLTVLDRVVAQAPHGDRRTNRSGSGSTTHRRVAREVQSYLAVNFHEGLTLDRIAAAVRYSPYQLCRIFRRETGTTIHRHLEQIRLRTALEHVEQGFGDLARLALELGYSSHSHFTHSFRRSFGLPPSAIRDLGSPRSLREMRKNLTA